MILNNYPFFQLFDFEFSFLGNPCFDLAGALVGYAMFCRAMDEKSETTRTTFHQEAKTAVERMGKSSLN